MVRFWNQYAPIPLRLMIGGSLVISGFVKVFTTTGQDNIEHLLTELGLPAPGLLKWVVGIVEFGGGVGIFLGAFVAILSIVNILNLVTLLLVVWIQGRPVPLPPLEGFPWEFPSTEVSVVSIAGLLALLLGGAGAWSIDAWRARKRQGQES